MLVAVGEPPAGPGWAFEVKWDGLRGQARIAGDQVALRSRNGCPVGDRFPELAAPPASLQDRAVLLDGELVVMDPRSGRPDFPAVAARLHQRPTIAAVAAAPVVFVAFDVLWADGVPLLGEPYRQRRQVLEGLALAGAWQITPAFEDAEAAWAAIAAHELEGLVAKRTASRYTPGRRSSSWLKRKAWATTRGLLVVGWRPSARPVQVLLAAEDPEGGLQLVGVVDWGLASAWQAGLADALTALHTSACPLGGPVPARAVRWVRPRLVADVRHLGWTPAGQIRQPVTATIRVA